MDFKNITIIGVGLIGGSLALALKKNGHTRRITGVGRNKKNLNVAMKAGIIDDCSTVHSQGVKDADLVIIAASVGQFEDIAKKISSHLKRGAIVTDVGSVKSRIINMIEPLMPEGVFFVGAHPIAGKECSGLDGATPDLFQNARCIITPSAHTKRAAMNTVTSLWKTVGMKTVIMTPEEHDQVFAAVSHMPHIVAYTLVNSILETDRKCMRYGGRGLKDITRIAMSSEELWRDICSYNREDILKTLRKFSSSVSRMIKLLEKSDWEGLEGEFKRAREARKLIESD